MMTFFMVAIVAGQLVGMFGPERGSAFMFESRAHCEMVMAEKLAVAGPLPEGLIFKCVDEKTFDALVASGREPSA
jgi:hypothetical protein